MSTTPGYTISDGSRALEPIKAQMGPSPQIQQRAQAVAVVLQMFKEQVEKLPDVNPQDRATVVQSVDVLASGMTAIATAQNQDGFDFALIRMCTPVRIEAAQNLGPAFVQSGSQYLAQHPEMTDKKPEPENVTKAKVFMAAGNIIATIPNWCTQYAANVQANAQAQQAAAAHAAQVQAANNQMLIGLFAGYLGYIGTPRYQGTGAALNNAYNAWRSVQ
jgi:hypothetical protein